MGAVETRLLPLVVGDHRMTDPAILLAAAQYLMDSWRVDPDSPTQPDKT